ncbi:DUF6660 family protein [Cyclobacterium sp.]|uniref:DUF6660 family protein n=1 Tax=Cyclobacterium sp. TaxID=1966343 RepID=UPI00199AF9AF|nr:DUF6660 family protein [Cyclobacterium sp.]MBD3628629.1 hypothetical protein [Cyclobacterium sp.]
MRRVLLAILSIYFLSLSIVPCADGVDCVELQVHQEMLTEYDHSAHERHAGQDFCAPFCACQCCHTSVTISVFFVLSETPKMHSPLSSRYSELPSSSYPASLLDPPQV